MIYFLYWIGVYIAGFSLCGLIKVQRSDEDDLPYPKEQLIQILAVVLMIGGIFIVSSLPFINYQREKEINIYKTPLILP